jgi:hypothetical protein
LGFGEGQRISYQNQKSYAQESMMMEGEIDGHQNLIG